MNPVDEISFVWVVSFACLIKISLFVLCLIQRPMPGFQTVFDPSQENLEMRLAEAEAYQKILEQQIKVVFFYILLNSENNPLHV